MSSALSSGFMSIVVLFAPACFHPNYDHPRCSPNGECPSGLSCSPRGICEAGGGIDAAPPDVCFGTAPFTICLAAAPTDPLTISNTTTIDTTNSPLCAQTLSGGSNYCVIAATSISIDATLRATGPTPLVLLARDTITANAMIDVGSHRGAIPEAGAGADPVTCDTGTAPTTTNETSGGGAGGSFLGLGGAGGTSVFGDAGGTPGPAASAISELRGGCPGQDGQGSTPGLGGHGGGAVYLIAGSTITIIGHVNAAGEGGGGGINCDVFPISAGGGGGAGGMIGFDAPTVVGSGLILANGGGGGGGCERSFAGEPGADPTAITAAIGGLGGRGNGGAGGNGSAGTAAGPGAAGGNGTCGACRSSP
jgi:hypothetical protein